MARARLRVGEDLSDRVSVFRLTVASESPDWSLSGASLAVSTYTDSSALFSSAALQASKPRLRHQLLDPLQFPALLGRLLAMAQSPSANEQSRVASLRCILNFLKSNSHSEFVSLFRDHTQVSALLSDTFIDQSVAFQQAAQLYLDRLGLLKSDGGFIEQ